MTVLSVEALDVGYSSKTVLRNICFSVNSGEFISVVAPNGEGKSTLLKTIAGILPTVKGYIKLKGKNLSSYSRREIAKIVAVVGSDVAYADYTVLQMVMMGRFAHLNFLAGMSLDDHKIVQASMEEVGVWGLRQRPCSELSMGERQKVIIARALAQQPELLLLDEPTAHLDVCNQFGILRTIRELSETRKIGVIAVIHDINSALQFSTSLLLLKDGGMLANGNPQQILNHKILHKLYGINFTLLNDANSTYVIPSTVQL